MAVAPGIKLRGEIAPFLRLNSELADLLETWRCNTGRTLTYETCCFDMRDDGRVGP